jgi:hypothetical protein
MKGFKRVVTLFAAVAACGLFPAHVCAETLEQRFEQLNITVLELRDMVHQQNKKIEQQDRTIRELRRQVESYEDVSAGVTGEREPHLDKHILHERSGLGEQLGNINVGIGLTGIVQGSIEAEDVSGENNDQTDGSWSMDIELESPVGERGTVFALIEAGQGEGLTDELAVFHGVNDDAGDSESKLEVTEAWYEHNFCQDRLVLTAGKLDLSNYVDGNAVANDETTQFLNTGLVNSLAIAFPEDNGAGIRVGVFPEGIAEFNFGWAESDADWEDIANDGFGIAEVNLKPAFLDREGNYRFYVSTGRAITVSMCGGTGPTTWSWMAAMTTKTVGGTVSVLTSNLPTMSRRFSGSVVRMTMSMKSKERGASAPKFAAQDGTGKTMLWDSRSRRLSSVMMSIPTTPRLSSRHTTVLRSTINLQSHRISRLSIIREETTVTIPWLLLAHAGS